MMDEAAPSPTPCDKATADSKIEFGEVRTPPGLVNEVLDLLPLAAWQDPRKTWLDAGAGVGAFSLEVVARLNRGLSTAIPETSVRLRHILTKMLFMVEVQPGLVDVLRERFGSSANIWCLDYTSDALPRADFDYVVGNPPFNSHGLVKVPTRTGVSKKDDGRTIWPSFVRRSLDNLRQGGSMAVIVPSLWMRRDRAGIFALLTGYKLRLIRAYDTSTTNRLFKGQAQTPTACFLVRKSPPDGTVCLFDRAEGDYVRYPVRPDYPLPLFGQRVVARLVPFVTAFGHLPVTISRSPPKRAEMSAVRTKLLQHRTVKSCTLSGKIPMLRTVYFGVPMHFAGIPKVILANKMYGFPYADVKGELGVSYRDNYVITVPDDVAATPPEAARWLNRVRDFLSTKLALYVFEAGRYRMRYLDKAAFAFIPNIFGLPNLPADITDESLAAYFGLSDQECEAIARHTPRSYSVCELPDEN